ncbi:monocarboxylate transporter 13-like isoform X1 [Tachypleus tridentatus]|uniref:monocarboxylate transporter 13-like isoform X1 n=1 Tax=Tachypleus tridentatus TaxID=6853 RepID=UPI003FD2ECAF
MDRDPCLASGRVKNDTNGVNQKRSEMDSYPRNQNDIGVLNQMSDEQSQGKTEMLYELKYCFNKAEHFEGICSEKECNEIDNTQTETFSSNIDFYQRWSWVVVCAVFVGFSLLAGLFYTVNLHFVVFLHEFHESRAHTAWIGSLFTAMMQLGGPFATIIIKAVGCRTTIICGAVGMAGGYIISSFATGVNYLIVSLGIVTASCISLVYSGFTVALGLYCHKYHGISTGIAFSGVGFGIFLFSHMLQNVLDEYGWRGMMFIEAGMALNVCVCGAVIFPLPSTNSQSSQFVDVGKETSLRVIENVTDEVKVQSFLKKVCHHSKFNKPVAFGSAFLRANLLFVDPKFTCFNIACTFWIMGIFALYVIYKDIAIFFGHGDQFSTVLSCMGIADIIGRVLVGIISSNPKCHTVVYSVVCHFVTSIAIALHIFAKSFEVFLSLGIVFSFCYAKQCVILALAPAAMYGRERLAATFGCLLFFCGCGALIGPPLGGWLMDTTGNCTALIWFCSLSNLGAAFLMIVVYLLIKNEKKCNQLILETKV